MSDTRDDAEQQMVNAGIASGLEDTLGSSLSGSFAPPDMKPPPAPEAPTPAQQISGSTLTEEDAGPVPGMEEWKGTYDKYVEDWQAESSIARQRAEETRRKIEEEHAAIAKKMENEKKSKQKEEAEKKRQRERDEKLKKELADEKAAGISRRRAERGGAKDDKDKVKEAWEMIKGGGQESKQGGSVGDGRGVMPQDVKAGNVQLAGDAQKAVNPAASSSSTADLPSTTRDQPPSPILPSSSQTLSATSTSQTWTEVSGNTSSAEDLSPARSGSYDETEAPPQAKAASSEPESKSGVPAKTPSQAQNTPPAQTPSLTLSMFTAPSHLSVSKIFAIIGINLVLPFVNGVMLGFGEIFAREAVRTGKHWWNAGLGIFGRGAAGRGTSGVGLSGSRGF